MPPGVRPVERIYESDIIRNATRPRAIPTILPPALGTTSRAYANARGSQAGLNIPNSTRATQGQPGYGSPIQAAASARLSGGGSGGGGGAVAAVDPLAGYVADTADLSKNPVPALYDQLLAYTQQQADARPAIFQAVSDKFKANQDAANKQLYDAYLGSRTEQDQSAVALGVDPAIVAQARDLAMRKNQENSDQSLADNQAWLLKAGLLSQQQAQAQGSQFAVDKTTQSAAWNQLEEERVAQLNLLKLQAIVDAISANKSSGGGGGRRGGGGGGSSGGSSVSQVDTVRFGGADQAIVDELVAQGRTEEAAAYINNHNLTMGNAELKKSQNMVNTLTKASNYKGSYVTPKIKSGFGGALLNPLNRAKAAQSNVVNAVRSGQAAYAKKQLPIWTTVRDANVSTSGLYNSPYSVAKVTTKGRT